MRILTFDLWIFVCYTVWSADDVRALTIEHLYRILTKVFPYLQWTMYYRGTRLSYGLRWYPKKVGTIWYFIRSQQSSNIPSPAKQHVSCCRKKITRSRSCYKLFDCKRSQIQSGNKYISPMARLQVCLRFKLFKSPRCRSFRKSYDACFRGMFWFWFMREKIVDVIVEF